MKKNILFAIIFILLIVVITFPLFSKITTHIPGFFSTDEPFAVLWNSWRIKYSFWHNLSLRYTPLVAHPFGIDLYSSGYLSYLWLGLFYFLSILTTPMLTYNLQVFLNLFLSGIFIYLLVFYLTENRLSAIISSIIFSFCPYQFMRIWQHLSLTYNQWIPLALFTAVLLKDMGTKKKYFFIFYKFDFSAIF